MKWGKEVIIMIKDKLKEKAKLNPKTIVYPEATEERILQAVSKILEEKIANVILLGNEEDIRNKANEMGINVEEAKIVNPETDERKEHYIDSLYELRKDKLVNRDEAKAILENYNYYGTMMVKEGDADGMISGSTHSTADTIRPALQIIKTKEGTKTASGAMIMEIEGKEMLFADVAVIPSPTSEQLADIAAAAAKTAQIMEMKPKIAMLSFSTKGSSQHESVEKVRKATILAKEKGLSVDGELQADAAIVKEVAEMKCSGGDVCGDANILIFPDLNSGNIGYKLVERLANCEAIGPIIQGLDKPVNDLSRGCKVEDIIDLTAYTVVEAQER